MFKEPTINNKTEEINKLTHLELSPEVSNHINKLWQEADVISVELSNLQNEKKTNESLQKDTKLKNRLATILNLITTAKENNSVEEEKTETEYISEEKALNEIKKLLSEEDGNNSIIAGLSGLDSEESWVLREKIYCGDSEVYKYIQSFAGNNSSRAWLDRGKLIDGYAENIGSSLIGLDSDQAWGMREKLMIGRNRNGVIEGLAGINSVRAWEMREEALDSRVHKASISRSLIGLESPRAWEMRYKFLESGHEEDVVEAMAGLDSKQSWEMREELLLDGVNRNCIAKSLAGIDSEQAWEMRERLLLEGANKDSVALGLAGLDSDRAWNMRKRLLNEGANRESVAVGINGNHITAIAWRLKRDRELNSKK